MPVHEGDQPDLDYYPDVSGENVQFAPGRDALTVLVDCTNLFVLIYNLAAHCEEFDADDYCLSGGN